MNVARILYPVEVLGPGKRIGIWMCGCHRACKGCSNPELWEKKPELEVSVDDIMLLINRVAEAHQVDGFTITGGEPMNQPRELSELIKRIKRISSDILVYSGYKLEELKDRDADTQEILDNIAVLIDGEYIEEKNDGARLRGSSNQTVNFLDESSRQKYEDYMNSRPNQIQNFTASDGTVSVGIHRRGFTAG